MSALPNVRVGGTARMNRPSGKKNDNAVTSKNLSMYNCVDMVSKSSVIEAIICGPNPSSGSSPENGEISDDVLSALILTDVIMSVYIRYANIVLYNFSPS